MPRPYRLRIGLADHLRAKLKSYLTRVQALDAEERAAISARYGRPTWGSARAEEGEVPTLHAEIAAILRDAGNPGMTPRRITSEVNSRGRYRKRDGTPVEGNQIHARVHNCPQMFERRGKLVYAR